MIMHFLNQFTMFASSLVDPRKQSRSCWSSKYFVRKNSKSVLNRSTSLDLGSGPNPQNPFECLEVIGLDVRVVSDDRVVLHDASTGLLPFSDSSFGCVSAFNFIEHCPRHAIINNQLVYPFVSLMNEIWRVLQPGGVFFSHTPAFPSPLAFSDPTHINVIDENTYRHYFCGATPMASIYGFKGKFVLLDQAWIRNAWLDSLLQKV